MFQCFLLCGFLWAAGLLWFLSRIPGQPAADAAATEAIVALTGGAARLEHALALLAQGKGRALFISGVHDKTGFESLLRQAPPETRARLTALGKAAITLGHQAENTIGNAEETARWLKREGYRSLRLVTANYHMPRSLEEFRAALPGAVIVPEPVFPGDFDLPNWWRYAESRRLLLLEYHKFLAAKLRHWFLSVTPAVSGDVGEIPPPPLASRRPLGGNIPPA